MTRRKDMKIVAAQLLTPDMQYHVEEYLNMLFSSTETLFGVFGHTAQQMRSQILHGEKQATLNE